MNNTKPKVNRAQQEEQGEQTTLYANKRNEVPVPDHTNETIHPGDTVSLLPPHPHAGRTGIYKGVERTAIAWMCLVHFDDGGGCYVSKASQWKKETP